MTDAILLGMLVGTGVIMAAASLRAPAPRAIPPGRNGQTSGNRFGRIMGERYSTDSSSPELQYAAKNAERSVLLDAATRISLFRNAAQSLSRYVSSSESINSHLATSLLITGESLQSLCAQSLFSAIAGLVIAPVLMIIL